jgi:mannitol-1-/sugar-/sorbitol-6-/2-deoxyglucose-6-phosphatase
MPIEAIIFDMDGVLVDSEPYWQLSREEFARDLGKVWPSTYQHLTMGRSTVEWARIMQERLEIDTPLDEISADIKRRVIAHYEQELPTRPGALEAVQLAAAHFRVGLASGSPTEIIQRVMSLTGLDRVFEVIVYGDDVPNGKPAPDIYLEALKRLGVSPERAVGIEDSGNGIRSLKAAGMRVIAAPCPGSEPSDDALALADRVIDSMELFSVEMARSLAK